MSIRNATWHRGEKSRDLSPGERGELATSLRRAVLNGVGPGPQSIVDGAVVDLDFPYGQSITISVSVTDDGMALFSVPHNALIELFTRNDQDLYAIDRENAAPLIRQLAKE